MWDEPMNCSGRMQQIHRLWARPTAHFDGLCLVRVSCTGGTRWKAVGVALVREQRLYGGVIRFRAVPGGALDRLTCRLSRAFRGGAAARTMSRLSDTKEAGSTRMSRPRWPPPPTPGHGGRPAFRAGPTWAVRLAVSGRSQGAPATGGRAAAGHARTGPAGRRAARLAGWVAGRGSSFRTRAESRWAGCDMAAALGPIHRAQGCVPFLVFGTPHGEKTTWLLTASKASLASP
jgi:hypothetical protein